MKWEMEKDKVLGELVYGRSKGSRCALREVAEPNRETVEEHQKRRLVAKNIIVSTTSLHPYDHITRP